MAQVFPHEPLAIKQVSLEQIVAAYRLAMRTFYGNNDPGNTLDKLINVILCGRWPQPRCRLVLNVAQGVQPIRREDCKITRDVDSVIVITDTLPYTDPLAVFPIPSFRDTLTDDVHLKGAAFITEVSRY